MQAAVLSRPQELTLTEVPAPTCPPGGVLVAVRACGICSADARMVQKGHPALNYARILGHEIAGVVVESRHSDWKPGQAVQVAPGLFCGVCRACLQGDTQRCLQVAVHGFSRDGGFAEYLSVPLTGPLVGALAQMPAEMDWGVACLAEPLACCINAQTALGVAPHQTVWIAGAGPLGLLHLMLARARGAAHIMVTDFNADRCRQALALGAHATLNADRTDLPAELRKFTGADGIDCLILATGNMGLTTEVLPLMARGGRIALFSGVAAPFNTQTWDINLVHYRELQLIGTYGCSALHNRQALAFLQQHNGHVRKLITWRGALSRIHAGLAHLRSPAALKAIVEISHGT